MKVTLGVSGMSHRFGVLQLELLDIWEKLSKLLVRLSVTDGLVIGNDRVSSGFRRVSIMVDVG